MTERRRPEDSRSPPLGQRWKRFLRRTLRRLQPSRTRLVFGGQYSFAATGVPVDPRRGENILTFLAAEGLARKGALTWPQPISFRDLCRVHDQAYLASLDQPEAIEKAMGTTVSAQEIRQLLAAQRAMAAGTLRAAELALAGARFAVNLGGGLHHAHADRGGGFCLIHDVAVAIAALRHDGFTAPILIVDLDLHDGDGTRALFAEDSSVHTFSIHNDSWGDETAVESTSIALGSEIDDEAFLSVLRQALPPVFERFRPGLVFYLAGTDPAIDDPLGNWKLSASALFERDRLVSNLVTESRPVVPMVIVLAGGYGTRTWRYTARFLGWRLSGGRVLEVPNTTQIILERYRFLSGILDRRSLSGHSAEDDWTLTEEDVLGALGQSKPPPRFLDFYTEHGIELALERYGLLRRLRQLGYEHPVVELSPPNPTGDTLRIFGDPEKTLLLGELRACRDSHSLEGFEVLRIEWLRLQNPRATDTEGRLLPGQDHPGLGLMRETNALLILICERLELDGILFVAAHYHLVAQTRGLYTIVEPAAEARFLALRDALKGLPLGEAAVRAKNGSVLDGNHEPLRYAPTQMVLPVSEPLRRHLLAVHQKAKAAEPSPSPLPVGEGFGGESP